MERVALGAFKVNHRGTGSAQYHPRMMLALLIYCYANGIFSSRRIERATHRDIGVRFVAANRHPDHDTIARFRRENLAAVSESFLQVLLLAKELKLLRVGLVSVDGSKFKANASKHRSVTYERAGALIAQLEGEIAALLSRAEAADVAGEEDPQALPQEIARREALRDKLDAARRHLEAQAEARAAAEREAHEAKVAAREKRRGRAKGKHPKPPAETPAADAQSNLSDPDSRLMRKSKQHEYRQAYNAQAAVDAGGSQLIVSARVSQCGSQACAVFFERHAVPVGNDRKFPICNDPKFLTLGLSLKAYRAVLLALPTERDRCADVQMGDQDVVEALSGPGRLEGGAVEAVRGEPSDDPQLGRYWPTGPGSGRWCARVFAPSAGGPQAGPLRGDHRRPS